MKRSSGVVPGWLTHSTFLFSSKSKARGCTALTQAQKVFNGETKTPIVFLYHISFTIPAFRLPALEDKLIGGSESEYKRH